MIPAYVIFAVLILIVCYQSLLIMRANERHDAHVEKIVSMYREEHQKLLDRIQAPSFAEYKQAEVKVIKAQNEPRETIKLEVV